MSLTIDDITALFEHDGGKQYAGEPVTQLEHALQSGELAIRAGAPESLTVAALLHDIGHLLADRGETPTARGIDDVHQYFALPFLRGLFPDAVLEPIRLHVEAKRYLCGTRPEYLRSLSPDSTRSLALQGGPYDAAQAAEFIQRPFASEATELRRWDDAAKVAGAPTRTLADFLPMMRRVAALA